GGQIGHGVPPAGVTAVHVGTGWPSCPPWPWHGVEAWPVMLFSGTTQCRVQYFDTARGPEAQLRFLYPHVRLDVAVVAHVPLRVRAGGEAGAAGLLDPRHREAFAWRRADRLDRRRRQGTQALDPCIHVELAGAQHAAVPQRMQVGALAAVIELVVIATAVVAVAGMQGLVRVAYEMDHELQRLQALGIAAAAVGEDACLHFKRLVDAAAVGAVGLALVAAASLADIDVVPRRAALAQAWIGTAQVVGPGGDPGERGFGLALQQARG